MLNLFVSIFVYPFIWLKGKRQEWAFNKLMKARGCMDNIHLDEFRNIFGALGPTSKREEIKKTRNAIYQLEEILAWPTDSSKLSKLLTDFENDQLTSTRIFYDMATLVEGKGEPNLVYKMFRRYDRISDGDMYFHGKKIDEWLR